LLLISKYKENSRSEPVKSITVKPISLKFTFQCVSLQFVVITTHEADEREILQKVYAIADEKEQSSAVETVAAESEQNAGHGESRQSFVPAALDNREGHLPQELINKAERGERD
jgi:hypothetical protein